MMEREAVKMVQDDPSAITNFQSAYWEDVDPVVLDTCFDKGFLRWEGEKLIVTPLGKRSCGGENHERHH